MHDVLYSLWLIFQVVIGYNLIMPVFVSVLAQLSKKKIISQVNSLVEKDFAVIVTAYEETGQLTEVVSSLLKMDYTNFHVYIVADKCDITGLKFPTDRVSLLRPPVTLGSNTASHFYAIQHFIRPHELLTIIDSDNLVEPGYLVALQQVFLAGYQAAQGTRTAKNLNTMLASLDGARDLFYNYYDGQQLFAAGSSATLAGSGMAFTTSLYVACLQHLDVRGAGFDKVLQYEIVKRGVVIAFTKNAIVYDEKTAVADQLVRQRARWINTWFRYVGFGFRLLKKGLTGFNKNQFLFGLILVRPPLFIFLILSLFAFMLNLWIAPLISLVWAIGFLLFTASFLIALKQSHADKRIYSSLRSIPAFVFYQVLSLLKMRKANKYSVATRHFYQKETENG